MSLGTRELSTFQLAGGIGAPVRIIELTLPTFIHLLDPAPEATLLSNVTEVRITPHTTALVIRGRTTATAIKLRTTSATIKTRTTSVKIGRTTDAELSEGIYG